MKKTIIISSVILSVALMASVLIYSNNLFKIQNLDNTLSTTGSATKVVDSDLAKLTSNFSRVVFEDKLKEGYTLMAQDEAKVVEFLKNNNITEEEYILSPIRMYEEYNYNKSSYEEKQYNLTQEVIITSTDIEKVKSLSQKANDLIKLDVIYQTNSPEYYYTKLPEERINLLPEAVKDAQERAEAIAASTDRKVGTLKSADMGVVQVMQPDSTDISSYGTYDTSTVKKEIMITVKANFVLK